MRAHWIPVMFLAAITPLFGCGTVHVRVESGDGPSAGGSETTGPASSTPAQSPRAASETPASGPPASTEEVCAIRQAIVTALRESPSDTTPWAASLADRTAEADCRLEPDGTARIGGWTMSPCGEDCDEGTLRFLFREQGVSTPAYAAEVVRTGEGGFRCSNLGQFLVIPGSTS